MHYKIKISLLIIIISILFFSLLFLLVEIKKHEATKEQLQDKIRNTEKRCSDEYWKLKIEYADLYDDYNDTYNRYISYFDKYYNLSDNCHDLYDAYEDLYNECVPSILPYVKFLLNFV